MKKRVFIMLLVAMLVPFATKAQNTLLVADGTATNNSVPIYGNWVDAYLHCQMIYPASMLTDMADKTIGSMTYYLASPASNTWDSAIFTVKVMEVSFSSFSSTSYIDVSDAVTVYSGELDGTGEILTIPFSGLYYYEGGNLLVDISSETTGSYYSCSFQGTALAGASLRGYSYSSVSEASCISQGFLPKTLFEWLDFIPVFNTDSLSEQYTVPVNNWYNYSLTETIITQDEIGGPTTIKNISYYYSGASPMTAKDNVTIWIQPTTKNQFSSSSDIDILNISSAVQVYSGSLNCIEEGWKTIIFDNPYQYDGNGNIMIIVDDNSGDYDGLAYKFYSFHENDNKALVWYSDSYNPDPTSSNYNGSKQIYSYRPIMYLGTTGANNVPEDTLSYCGDAPFEAGLGRESGGFYEWGIMLTPSMLYGHNYLKSVCLFVRPNYPGTYTLNIYNGGETAPGSLYCSQTTTFNYDQSGWQEIELDTLCPLTSQNLWITFSTTDITYPASSCEYTGDINSDWRRLSDGTWGHLTDVPYNYSWMIKAVVSNEAPTPIPNVSIAGQQQLAKGQAYTFRSNYSNTNWYLDGVMCYTGDNLTMTLNTTGYHDIVASVSNSNGTGYDTMQINVIDYTVGDTVSYVLDRVKRGRVGHSNPIPFSWGIKLPAAFLGNREYVDEVLVGAGLPGTYTLRLYQGGDDAPQTLIHTTSFIVTSVDTAQDYYSVVFPSPIYISNNSNLWVVVHTENLDYPANVSFHTTDTNSDWISQNDTTWSHLSLKYSLNYSWMIMVVFGQSCPAISSFPYTQDFEDGLGCWSVVDGDNDGRNWYVVGVDSNRVHGGSHAITSASFENPNEVLYPDNWLISPPISVNMTNLECSYYVNAQDSNWASEHLAVYVTTIDNTDFISLFAPKEEYTLSSSNWIKHTIPLSNYYGQTVYISFRHYNCSDMFRVNIDDIRIGEPEGTTYTITAIPNDESMGVVIGGGTYSVGTTVSLTALANSGYHFSHWSNGSSLATISFVVTEDANYVAYFEADYVNFTISAVSADPTMGTVTGGGTYTSGSTAVLSAIPYSGYIFSGWQDGNTDNPRYVLVSGNATYTALFSQGCTVSSFPYTQGFENGLDCWSVVDGDNDGHNWFIASAPGEKVHGGSYSIASASYDNDSGVLYPNNFLISPAFNINSSNLTLSYYINAQDSNWVADHIAVYISTTSSISGITSTTPVEEYTLTSAYTGWVLHSVPLSGYYGQTVYVVFRHYNCSDQFRVNIDDISIAVPTATTYTITTVSSDPTMGIVTGGGSYTAGSTAVLTAIPYSGYVFSGWQDGNTNNPRYITVNNDAIYTAIFEQEIAQSYSVTVNSNDMTMGVATGGGMYYWGDTAILTATANNGYHFVQWNDGNISNPRSVVVTSNASYTAYFAINVVYYTVTAEPNDPTMGNVTGGGMYASGAIATITANPYNGYHFVQWNDGNTEPTRSFTVSGDVSYTATFANNLPNYTITVNSNNTAWGTVSGGGNYQEGTSVTLYATPNNGYHFSHWQDGDTNAIRTITITANATYTATFEENAQYFTITVQSNDLTRGIVSGGGVFLAGETVTIHAEALPDNYFLQWQDGDTNANRTINVVANATYTAYFMPNPVSSYTVSAIANDATMGVVTGGGTFNEGSVVTLNAIAFEGYEFVKWDDENIDNPRQITVLSDTQFVALFQPLQAITEASNEQITIYPNPAKDNFEIKLNSFIGDIVIEIIDINGRIVENITCNSSSTITVDVSNLASGTYLVRINNNGVYTKKRLIINN